MKIFFTILILAVAFLISATFFSSSNNQEQSNLTENYQVEEKPEAKIFVNRQEISVAVADTPAERERGLSGRSKVPFQGMLFIFDNSSEQGFWMKDMHFSLDIVWINENFEVIGIEREVAPETFPDTFRSGEKIKYVLEIPAGFSKNYGLEVGSEVRILFSIEKS